MDHVIFAALAFREKAWVISPGYPDFRETDGDLKVNIHFVIR